jgi:hypothetical protein
MRNNFAIYVEFVCDIKKWKMKRTGTKNVVMDMYEEAFFC